MLLARAYTQPSTGLSCNLTIDTLMGNDESLMKKLVIKTSPDNTVTWECSTGMNTCIMVLSTCANMCQIICAGCSSVVEKSLKMRS